MTKALASAGRFLWDFFVGESPASFVATLVVVGAAFALRHTGWLAAVVLPVLVVATLVAGAYRGRRRSLGGDPTA
jgi:hypothetical protein